MTTDNETTEELSAGEQTRRRVLDAAVKIAQEDGIEGVTHKTVAAATELSSSNVSYYFGKALDLRRAAALELLARFGPPEWGYVEFWVLGKLPEGHPQRLAQEDLHPGLEAEIHPGDELDVAEAMVWLARNGVT